MLSSFLTWKYILKFESIEKILPFIFWPILHGLSCGVICFIARIKAVE